MTDTALADTKIETPAVVPPADVKAPEAKVTETKAADQAAPPVDAKPGDKPADAPADPVYEFKAPEGVELSEAHTKELTEFAKANKISPEAAQKILERDIQSRQAAEQQHIATHEKRVNDWKAEIEADPEFGGPKFKENAESARRAAVKFIDPATLKMLDETGFGNHPGMVKAWAKVGALLREDTLAADKADQSRPKTTAEKMYPNAYPQA